MSAWLAVRLAVVPSLWTSRIARPERVRITSLVSVMVGAMSTGALPPSSVAMAAVLQSIAIRS